MRLCFFLLCMTIPTLAGCGGDRPPNIRYGEEACARCRMIINDDRFAAAVTLDSGELLKFDDIGCLFDHLAQNRGKAAHSWIRGYRSGQWHDVEHVYFVNGPQLQTPMASGLAAVNASEEADALAKQWGGKALRFSELSMFFETRRAVHAKDDAAPTELPTKSHKELR